MRKTVLRLMFLLLILSSALAAVARQASPSISVSGDVKQPLTLTAVDLAAMPRAKAVTDNNGVQTTYEGVWLSDVLKKAGVPLGLVSVERRSQAMFWLRHRNGYQVVSSIGELDPDMTDSQFLLADTVNGKPLFGENGPFRLVIPKDKRGARSVRLLSKIEVVQLRK